MPITLNPPIDNLFVGPGTRISVHTDFIGPFPTGSYWRLDIVTRTGEEVMAQGFHYQVANSQTLAPNVSYLLNGQSSVSWIQPLPAAAAPVQQATAIIRLIQAPSTVLEQTSTPVQWFPDPAGIAYVQSLQPSSVQGGFVQSDRNSLESVLKAVQLVLPSAIGGGPNLLMQVIDLVRGPPRSLLRPFGTLMLTGRGAFSAKRPYRVEWRPQVGPRPNRD